MKQVFVDALYWIAITNRKDQWHQSALDASHIISGYHLVTTDEVLTEVSNAFCEKGLFLRQQATALIRYLSLNQTVTVHPQSRQSFNVGLAFL